MPKINETLHHSLGQECAIERIKQLIPRLQEAHGDNIDQVREDWQGNRNTFSFSAVGFNVSGTIEVTDSKVELYGDLPFAAYFFKGQIVDVIQEEGAKLLL